MRFASHAFVFLSIIYLPRVLADTVYNGSFINHGVVNVTIDCLVFLSRVGKDYVGRKSRSAVFMDDL